MKGSREETERDGKDLNLVPVALGGGEPNLKIWTGGAVIDGSVGLFFVLTLGTVTASILLLFMTEAGRTIFRGFLLFCFCCCAARIRSRNRTSAAKRAVKDLLDLLCGSTDFTAWFSLTSWTCFHLSRTKCLPSTIGKQKTAPKDARIMLRTTHRLKFNWCELLTRW